MIRVFALRAGAGGGLLALLLGLTGCGSEVKLVPAEGVLKIGGKPAPNISVQFLPDAGKGNGGPTSFATTDAEGKFRLKTYDGRDGAVPGTHAVVLADLDEERPAQGKERTKAPRLALKYSTAGPDGLRAEVPAAGGSVALDVPAAR
jgi:hypothetical protein